MSQFYELAPKDAKGEPYPFEQLKGKVVLIVNVASKCGFTPQYKGLEELNKKFADQPVQIMGFPCNQFGHQEPDNTDPVYKYLKSQKSGVLGLTRIKWNFEKFLIDQNGKVIERFSSLTSPESIGTKIEELLKK